jgi:hypothetical protein
MLRPGEHPGADHRHNRHGSERSPLGKRSLHWARNIPDAGERPNAARTIPRLLLRTTSARPRYASRSLLLGRITYEGFAAAWPTMEDRRLVLRATPTHCAASLASGRHNRLPGRRRLTYARGGGATTRVRDESSCDRRSNLQPPRDSGVATRGARDAQVRLNPAAVQIGAPASSSR